MRLRIASRQSDLARIQSHEVAKALKNAHPGLEVEFHFSESLGDKNLTDPLWKMPGKGVFTEDLTKDLMEGKADLIVHSWKDLPVEERAETQIVATLERADARDLLLFKKKSREKLETKSPIQIFSSSPRREYNLKPFLKEYLPGQPGTIEFVSVRGNIPTRLRKLLESSETDGLIVAKAAIDRLLATKADEFEAARVQVRAALKECEWMVLPLSANPAAAAQGALAVEIRRDRDDVRRLLQAIHHEKTFTEASSERKILKTYGGGCHQKIGVTVLARDFEETKTNGLRLLFLKGLTDKGEILNKAGGESPPNESFSVLRSNWLFERKNRSDATVPSDVDALFVSQAAAVPENMKWTGILWTAGLSTWKKMAASGYWVHGSSEGLGESEDPRIEAFTKDLRWGTLTHSQSAEPPRGKKVITYDLIPKKEASAPPAGRLHWTSASLFDEAVKRWPELKNRAHSCGPGKTLEHLRTQVKDLTVRWLGDEGKT